ncbi:hypothetical protein [Amycolatopsis nalaikhensis]|uniref:Secreted protein n=1 Tax=Amycolatopsis nalaikhensis TaxID=715472 RepID=A0ABY8XYE6_9PSEU|nr:hypothetical protein [Amycolatopsis sp. 2-2]WIV60447.1 hypothetical protein QP939_18460 [Amycolatopsis sp. 2-2]
MRTIRRAMAAGALALPLTLGAAGIASADSFGSTEVQAGPDGAATHSVRTGTHDGGSGFHEVSTAATPDGAAVSGTTATADQHGDTQYRQQAASATEDGVATQDTSATSDTHADIPGEGVLSGTLDAIAP